MALAAYRNLWRASRIAFQGDLPTLAAARTSIRTGFRANVATPDPEASANIAHANEVASFLRQNVVQGQRMEGGDRYQLRIHEDTERGDNDTIKMAGGTVKVGGQKCCSER